MQISITIHALFYILLTVHPNIMIDFFFTNLMHKFFILIHLLYSFTCFEHYYAHIQEDIYISTASRIVRRTIVLVQHLVSSGGQLY